MAERDSKKLTGGELPFQVGKGLRDRQSGKHGVTDSSLGTWGTVVRAAQGNFDHLMGVIRSFARAHNSLVDDVSELKDVVEGSAETTAVIQAAMVDPAHTHVHGTEASGNLHPEYLTEAEGDAAYADITEPIAVAHRDDTTAAHAASAISVVPAGSIAATQVQAALEELDSEKSATTHAHDATYVNEVDHTKAVHDALNVDADTLDGLDSTAFESAGAVAAHTGDTTDAHDASAISVVDAGGHFTGTDVEAVLQELGAGGGGGGDDTYSWFLS